MHFLTDNFRLCGMIMSQWVNKCIYIVSGNLQYWPLFCIHQNGIRAINKHSDKLVNSSPPSAAYMHKWTGSQSLQVMPASLFGAKPLPEPMLNYCQLDPSEETPVKFDSKYKTFIYENAFENFICKMVAIYSKGRWVDCYRISRWPGCISAFGICSFNTDFDWFARNIRFKFSWCNIVSPAMYHLSEDWCTLCWLGACRQIILISFSIHNS